MRVLSLSYGSLGRFDDFYGNKYSHRSRRWLGKVINMSQCAIMSKLA